MFCTISTADHLPKAACLARSLFQTQPDHRFLLCLVERDDSAVRALGYSFLDVVLASNLGISNFESFIFRHVAFEACMAVKADVLFWAMVNYPQEDLFVYLDADTFVYSRFEELESVLSRSAIVLTPHHVDDEVTLEAVWDQMSRTLACGTFNSGFLALQRSEIAEEFLEWWSRKLRAYCYRDASHGLYYEQKWLDLALGYFDVTIFREPGYNVANWNISQRRVTACQDHTGYIVNGKPLRFFHFSMVDSGRDMLYLTKYASPNSAVFELRDRYTRAVEGVTRAGNLSQMPWSYESFASGERIAVEVRTFFRSEARLRKVFSNPFDESNFKIMAAMGSLMNKT